MVYCPDCGTANEAGSRFCQWCGRQLGDVVEAQAVMNPPVGGAVTDTQGRMIADDGLPIGQDLDGEPGGERLLWNGRPSPIAGPRLAIVTRYRVTNERLMMVQGFVSRKTEEVELYRVNDVAVKQNVIERLLGIGDVRVVTTDSTAPQRVLQNVRDPDRVKDLVREASRAERQRRRVLFREEV